MKIDHLTNTPVEIIRETFNLAFADYFVKLQLTKDQFENKMIVDGVNLSLSIGAFDGSELVGFILHGYSEIGHKKLAYNAGTGVVPEFRGRCLTKLMYQHLMPTFNTHGINNCSLEVISNNFPAFKTYNSIGFVVKRELVALKGIILIEHVNAEWQIAETDAIDFDVAQSFWDWQPSWQNSIQALGKLTGKIRTLTVSHENKLIAYASYNPFNKRVAQFAVEPKYRRKGIATAIFKHIAKRYNPEISVINVEKNNVATNLFLNSIRLVPFANQFEMELSLE